MKPKHKSSSGNSRQQQLIALLPALMSAALMLLVMSMMQFYSEKQLQILKAVGNEKRETLLAINDVANAQQMLQGEVQTLQNNLEHVRSAFEEAQSRSLRSIPNPPLFHKNGTLRQLPRRRLFIIINSFLGGERRRAAIRESWLGTLQTLYYSNDTLPMHPLDIEARFFVGSSSGKSLSKTMQAVHDEIKKYNDVTIVKARDEYQTLGTKVPLLYHHVTSNYDCDFVAKVDDDVYMNVQVFTSLIERMNATKSYLGKMVINQPVVRHGHKNAEPNFPTWLPRFPPYASGCATIVSNDLAQLLANPPLTPLKMLNDDAFLGLLFLPFDVTYVHEQRIFPWGMTTADSNRNTNTNSNSTSNSTSNSNSNANTDANANTNANANVTRHFPCYPSGLFAAIHYVMPLCTPGIHYNVTHGLPICNSKTCRVDQTRSHTRFLKAH